MIVLRESAGSGGRMPRWISSPRRFSSRFQPGDFLFRHLGQLRIRRLGLQKRAVLRQVGHDFEVSLSVPHQLFEPGVLLPQLLRPLRIVEGLGIAQGGFDLRKAAGEPLDMGTQVHDEK